MNDSENEQKNDTDLSADDLTDIDDKGNATNTDDNDQPDDVNTNENEQVHYIQTMTEFLLYKRPPTPIL